MFAWWGRTVYRYRFIVIGVMVALCLGGGLFGMSLGEHVTQSGFYDDNTESVRASVLADQVYGRDRAGHIVAVLPAPSGKTVDDPDWSKKISDELNAFVKSHPDQVIGWAGYLRAPDSDNPVVQGMKTADKKYTFVSIPLKGDDDDTILNNYKDVSSDLQKLDGGKVELAGLEPVAEGLTGTIDKDQKRMEVLALPLVAVVLFLVFGGVVAAFLPAMVGGLAIAGALGILRFTAMFGPVHFFAQPVVSMIGLGIAVDYALFVVSRFREELAEGYDPETAVRRTVITAGRTVTFSAVLIAVSAASMLVFPQGFMRSLTYAMIAAVMLSAILSITVLPAALGVLGENVDALGVRTLFRVPFLADWKVSRGSLTWLADLLQKTKTRDEVENEFWGKLVNRVMKRPLLFALPIIVIMILLIIPVGKMSLGAFSEKYLPPDNSVRLSQEHFDKLFPGYRTEQMTLVIESTDHKPVTDRQVADIRNRAMAISGFTDPNGDSSQMWQERPYAEGASKDPSVRVIQNSVENPDDAARKIVELRAITPPKGLDIMVGGTQALVQDSIHGIFSKMPLMLVILLTTTTLLMFLAFGSLVLPIKATVMSALTLGSTMGILTWIFVDGHFSHLLNFTATPLTAPVIGMIIAIVFGLSTDYEVFLVSRMVEAREAGMSTAEAIRIGTATTGRIITAAAAVLAVVAGSFVFSDLVMLKYLAFGLMAALLLDATVVRMFLVPSVMKLLGDDCWWAPRWMKRVQTRIGLGEVHLPNERRRRPAVRPTRPAAASTGKSAGPKEPAALEPAHPKTGDAVRPGPDGPVQAGRVAGDGPAHARGSRVHNETQRPAEPPTTRLPAADSKPHPRSEREIESWLDELRPDRTPPAPSPADEETRSMRVPDGQPQAEPAQDSATTAIPVPEHPDSRDSRSATEKVNTTAPPSNGTKTTRPRRGGGGLSAQELLRREGRY
ncbi:MAG TPA: efflux RND transporter permease subunit [Mycobacterium sp.]|nr:efflux RND transporter permease subunit [Mycobacterium sp.]